MIAGIADLNSASREEAFAGLLACCGSTRWATRLLEARPFADLASLKETAESISEELIADDWLEAFASHPRIGARSPQRSDNTARGSAWSAEEQAGTRDSGTGIRDALAAASLGYEERFGYVFMVCATGKSSEEMLAICRQRLNNDHASELRIAADELRKIAGIRFGKLIGAVD